MCFLLLELEKRHRAFQKHETCCPFPWEQGLVLKFRERKYRLGDFHLGLGKGPLFSLHLNMDILKRATIHSVRALC